MRQYYITTDGSTKQGPIDEIVLRANFAQGAYPPTTMVWTEGMVNWTPINVLFDITPSNTPNNAYGSYVPSVVPGVAVPSNTPNNAYGSYNNNTGTYDTSAYGNPISALRYFFKHYTDFSGRATRYEFWMTHLSLFIVLIPVFILGLILGELLAETSVDDEIAIIPLVLLLCIFGIVILIPSLALCWRRLHDSGKSGALYFLSFIPYIGELILLVFFLLDSERGTNQYGPSAKYPH